MPRTNSTVLTPALTLPACVCVLDLCAVYADACWKTQPLTIFHYFLQCPGLTVKIIGRQWYWSYEMHDHLQHKLLDADKLVDLAARSLDK